MLEEFEPTNSELEPHDLYSQTAAGHIQNSDPCAPNRFAYDSSATTATNCMGVDLCARETVNRM